MVTYLPTILMNIINQATNYIKGEDRYQIILDLNITSLMVLASIYLTVSNSLPSSSNIKPVEIWLLFNLAYPFLVIMVNILLQVGQGQVAENTFLLILSILKNPQHQEQTQKWPGKREKREKKYKVMQIIFPLLS